MPKTAKTKIPATDHRYECYETIFGEETLVVIYHDNDCNISSVSAEINGNLIEFNQSTDWLKNKSAEIKSNYDLLFSDDIETLRIDIQLLRKDCKRLQNELDECRKHIQ